MVQPEEHRRHERFAGTLTVQVSGDGAHRFATIYEVSLGGAFLAVSPLPVVGAVVDIAIVESGVRHVLQAEVRYREASQMGPRGVEGVGVSWHELGGAERSLIERVVGRAQLGQPLRGA
jgi:hypothetical protein